MEALSTYSDDEIGTLLDYWGAWSRVAASRLHHRRIGLISRLIDELIMAGSAFSEYEVAAVNSVVATMPPTMRAVVERTWLRQVHDLEGADNLRMTLDAYRSWQHRACRHLADRLLVA